MTTSVRKTKWHLRYTVDPATECWDYIGKVKRNGYAQAMIDGRYEYVHRAMYKLHIGPIPTGLEIDHACRNRRCMNPQHMEAVTHAENMRRAVIPRGPRKTHCPQGHPYDGTNVRVGSKKDGRLQRVCRACDRVQSRARRNRKAAV